MHRRLTPWLLGGLLALGGSAGADETASQDASPAAAADTVRPEDVKTWTIKAGGKEWEAHPATPSYDGTTGLFHLPSAYSLSKGKVSFSLFRDNIDRDPKDEDISHHGASFGIGITDHLEGSARLNLQTRIDADALFQPGYTNEHPFVSTGWETGFGDVTLGLKYKFSDDYQGDGVASALRGWVKLPSADDAKGLGTGKPSFGADVMLGKHLNRAVGLHGSLGFAANSDPDEAPIGNALRWGVGLNTPCCKWIQLYAEATGSVYSGDDESPQTNPIDVVVGPVVWIRPGFFIRPGISWNINFDDRGLGSGSQTYTGRHLAVGFHPAVPCREIYVPPPPPPPPVNRMPTVVCEIEKSLVKVGESVRCRATGSDPDGDPLTYSWTASAGKISGVGPQATLDTTGVEAPSTITVTVTASDGKGGTAESKCTVSVEKPTPPPVAECLSQGFPRNGTRLNNVDKACLDDIASRLKSDPRSRVIVQGHADKGEQKADVLARKRAEAIKDYLVKERGVDEARITVLSAGATKPADTGKTAAARAKNRRVRVIFVPDGATAPVLD